MKRGALILGLIFLVLIGWMISRQLKSTTKIGPTPTLTPPGTNSPTAPPAIVTLLVPPVTNTFVRPNSIDEEHWNRLMLVRQLALKANQPVEFYAHVVDQNGQPIEGAKLSFKLIRTDETMFETTNFFRKQMGDEVLTIPFDLISDASGRIHIKGTNGSFLDLIGLSKAGYVSEPPDGYLGGVHYEADGTRTTYGGDLQMTNALNPEIGYLIRLKRQ